MNNNRKLTANIPLKIMSILVGILVWLLVVNVDNPIKTRTIIIPGENVEVIIRHTWTVTIRWLCRMTIRIL